MMTNLAKWAGICAVIVLMLASTNGMLFAQDAKIFEGSLIGVDANARILTRKAGDSETGLKTQDILHGRRQGQCRNKDRNNGAVGDIFGAATEPRRWLAV